MANGRGGALLFGAALLALVALGAGVRIQAALSSPHFDLVHPEGLLRSDPGLLYYLTERVVEAGGATPDDWREDPRIQYPDRLDVPATFTVGQEFVIAWTRRLGGSGVPLHVWCVWIMGTVASLSVVGVAGLARELTRSRALGLLAGVLFLLVPAGHRTIGFILMREDLSLPLFALHLFGIARAARVRSVTSFALAGATLGAALATWHAMTFVVALEAAGFLAWYLWRGASPFADGRALIVPAVALLFALTVPALQAKSAALSLPFLLLAALLVPTLAGADRRPALRLGLALATLGAGVFVARAVGGEDLRHVFEVMGAKIVHLGGLPDDPSVLSFEARMLWQGPFESPSARYLLTRLHAGLLFAAAFLILVANDLRRGTLERGSGLLALLLAGSLAAGVLVSRMLAVPALLVPVAAVLVLERLSARMGRRSAIALVGATLVAFLGPFATWRGAFDLPWHRPPARQQEIRALVEAVRRHVPEPDAIAADFMTSTAILAATGRPIVLQPKWETLEARERVRTFWREIYGGTPQTLRRLLLERYRCRWLVVERSSLFSASSRFMGGMRRDQAVPAHGSPLWFMLQSDAHVLRSMPGFELVWRSPSSIRLADGTPSDLMRLYRIVE